MKPDKVYVVQCGDYSDAFISAVFLDKKKAENYVKYHPYGFGSTSLLEYELEDDSYEIVESGYVTWRASMRSRITSEGVILRSSPANVRKTELFSQKYLTDNNSVSIMLDVYTPEDGETTVEPTIFVDRVYAEGDDGDGIGNEMEKILHDLTAEFANMLAESGSWSDALDLFDSKYRTTYEEEE